MNNYTLVWMSVTSKGPWFFWMMFINNIVQHLEANNQALLFSIPTNLIWVSKYSTTLVCISHFFVGTNSPSTLYLSTVVIKLIFNITKCNLVIKYTYSSIFYSSLGLLKIKSILFKLDSVRSGCPISRARGSCIKRSSIPDRIGI